MIITFLFSISSAILLLLFGVRMVRTGIERSYGASFQRFMTGQTSLVRASTLGIGLAILLQSSAAVALLTAGFAASGPPVALCGSAADGRTLAPTGGAGAVAGPPRLVLRTAPALAQGICAFCSCLSASPR